eukprot:gene5295-10588_t
MARLATIFCIVAAGFQIASTFSFNSMVHRNRYSSKLQMSEKPRAVLVTIPLGEGLSEYTTSYRAIFPNSEFIVITYAVPFSLNVEPKQGMAIVTKDGKNGEQVGDIMRATTCFSQGFVAAGAATDIMAFAGNVKWRKGIFETSGAPWSQILDALLSNTPDKTTDVTIVFERETAPLAE